MTPMKLDQPVWRSLLYVPANNPRFIDKAHTRQADGIILDLEDAVPATERDRAREALSDAARSVGQSGADVLVRVNSTWDDWPADLEAAVLDHVDAIILTKVESAEGILERVEKISTLEEKRGISPGKTRLFVLAETPQSIFRLEEIAKAHERIVAMGLGGEDFSAAVGSQPGPDTLALPKQLMLYAARAAGISPLGLIGTVADYKDLESVREVALNSRRFGFDGASCIHPGNVPVLNEAFAPSQVEISEARRVVDAYEEALDRGVGAITIDGWMIDVPVAERARKVIARADAIAAREARTRAD